MQSARQSLEFRFACENVLIDKAMQQPFCGWANHGGNFVVGPDGSKWAVTDGFWIIFLGCYGCYGLFSWTAFLLLPAWLFVVRYPVEHWKMSTVGPLAVIATMLGMYIIDCLLNGFINLVYVVGRRID